jgi:acetyl-CoA acetyltransferase family protein
LQKAWICDAVRTPIGRYGGGLATVRTDDLGAIPIRALIERNPNLDPGQIDDLIYGCANQAGEDNRNVARMSGLLAGLPPNVPAATVNRLCGSGMNAVGNAAHAIQAGQADLLLAGGVESMSRAPFVMAKATTAFSRNAEIYDTTLGWRFVNKRLEEQYGIDSMAETAENVAEDFKISRDDQDQFALRSQLKAAAAIEAGRFDDEIVAVSVPQRKGDPLVVDTDEHPRAASTIEGWHKLRPIVR